MTRRTGAASGRGARGGTLSLLALGLSLVAGPAPAQESAAARTWELRNARFFTGTGFVEGTRWIQGGRITTRKPARVDSVLDLRGRWVVPAFGEAHNHNGFPADTAIARRYLAEGIFFVKNPNNRPKERVPAPAGVPTIDVAYANGGITGPGGHPVFLVTRNVARGAWTAADGEGSFLHTVASRADVDRMWPKYVADRPDFVKTYLLHSEQYARRLADTTKVGWRGMDPALLPYVVRRARRSRLRVTTHVETAADFRLAVAAGVHEIAHLPGFRPEGDDLAAYGDLARYRLTPADARLARRKGVTVVTTVSEVAELAEESLRAGDADTARARDLLALLRHNLSLLLDAGVPVALGSDRFRESSLAEARTLVRTKLLSPAAALRAWSMHAPRTIFPGRRVGCLEDGCEANLLVLDGDPLVDFGAVERIRARWSGVGSRE